MRDGTHGRIRRPVLGADVAVCSIRGGMAVGKAVQAEIGRQSSTPIATNIDGLNAVVFCELGFPPPFSRRPFCLSRQVGVLVHGWERMPQGAVETWGRHATGASSCI